MSRAAAAQSGSTIPKPLHLVVQHSNNGAALMVSSDAYPANQSIAMSPEEFRTFRMIWHWMQMADRHDNPSFRGKRSESESAPKIPFDFLVRLLTFIKPDLASFLMNQLDLATRKKGVQIKKYPNVLSIQSMQDGFPLITASSFFDYTPQDLPSLLSASLNANLDDVIRIVSKASPDRLRWLLQTSSTAMTTLGRITVERSGTPLQMAIYDHDEEMVAYFKGKMDPAEFQRQCEAVLGADYNAFLEKQQKEAKDICAGLEDAFKAALANEFTCDTRYVSSTSSTTIPNAVDAFIKRLTDYVARNPVHNPYILQNLYEIYERLLPSDFNRDCFFSQKVIGGAHSFLSPRWLQHYTQGVYYLAENNEAPRRSFICRDSNPGVDGRLLACGGLGVDSFLSIFGRLGTLGPWPLGAEAAWCVVTLSKLMSSKNNRLSELITPRVPSTRCCIIQ